MERLLLICLAGAAGTAARYLITLWAAERFAGPLPLGTLIVNLAGCFAMAVLIELASHQAWPETLRLTATTGFLGGFTTYSTFNQETMRLLNEGASAAAVGYAAATVAGGFAAGWAGLVLARQLWQG